MTWERVFRIILRTSLVAYLILWCLDWLSWIITLCLISSMVVVWAEVES